MTPEQYWQNNSKLEHITPPNERWPEVGLSEALKTACIGSVFEFGCGDGRLSSLFNTSQYYGYDINEHALKQARLNNPNHEYVSGWIKADTVLAYTVLLHITDDKIGQVIERMQSYDRIVIGEITGRKWRRNGNPPVFNRSIDEYAIMINRKYSVTKVHYPRYGCDLDLMVFV